MSDDSVSGEPEFPIWLETLVGVSAAIAVSDWESVQADLENLASANDHQAAVEEAILQTYLFAGFPAALTAARIWRRIVGKQPVDSDPLALPLRPDEWEARGEVVCRVVYGSAYEKLRANIATIHPALDRWMVMEGYGKVLGRPGLDLMQRELCIVGLLTAGAWEEQLYSHLRGAMLAGAPVDWIIRALEIGLSRVGPSESARLRDVWDLVQSGGRGEQHVH